MTGEQSHSARAVPYCYPAHPAWQEAPETGHALYNAQLQTR